jgi:hypothetical protein
VLFAAGQPNSRPGRSFRWCVAGQAHAQTAALFGSVGHVIMVASSSGKVSGGKLHPGSHAGAKALKRAGRRLAAGLWLSKSHGSHPRRLYRVRGGKVVSVAVVSASEARRGAKRLRSDLRAVGLS